MFKPAFAESVELAAGQSWTVVNGSGALVVIGAVENDVSPGIIHVVVTGLPNLDGDATAISGGYVGNGAGPWDDAFWCEYKVAPGSDGKIITFSVVHLPIAKDALVPFLETLTTSSASLDFAFRDALDRWDYLRDEYGIVDSEAAIAQKPLPQTLREVQDAAQGSVVMVQRIIPEMFGPN